MCPRYNVVLIIPPIFIIISALTSRCAEFYVTEFKKSDYPLYAARLVEFMQRKYKLKMDHTAIKLAVTLLHDRG